MKELKYTLTPKNIIDLFVQLPEGKSSVIDVHFIKSENNITINLKDELVYELYIGSISDADPSRVVIEKVLIDEQDTKGLLSSVYFLDKPGEPIVNYINMKEELNNSIEEELEKVKKYTEELMLVLEMPLEDIVRDSNSPRRR